MLIKDLYAKKLITLPSWLPDNTHYLTEMGSIAYGTATADSDIDIYGFCIPPKDDVFPHLRGEIPGFGRQIQRFEQWQMSHIVDGSTHEEYDLAVYSIVRYFQLCMDNNPNMIDSLFTPHDCVRHITKIGQMVRDSRKLFLHKGSFHKFRGYAFSQISKMSGKTPMSKRYGMVQEYGYDLKYATHVVRLVCEAEQILTVGDIDLRRDAEMLKSIRRGEWTEARVRDWFTNKERDLELLYNSSTVVPYKPDEEKIKTLLLNCLEEHYGDLSAVVVLPGREHNALLDIQKVLKEVGL